MKNKEWLKEEVKSLFDEAYDSGKMEYYESEESIHRINSLVDQLDEPETLSEEWINEHSKSYTMENSVEISDLKNLLLPQPQKPVIPQFVANYIEKYKGNGFSLGTWLHFVDGDDEDECDTVIWLYGGNKEEKLKREYLLLDAIRYGYEVERELYYYVVFEGEFNPLYVTHVDIYGENGKFNYNSVFDKKHALKFTDKSKAEYLADFLGAIVVEVTQ